MKKTGGIIKQRIQKANYGRDGVKSFCKKVRQHRLYHIFSDQTECPCGCAECVYGYWEAYKYVYAGGK